MSASQDPSRWLAALAAEHGVPGVSLSVLRDGVVTDVVAGVVSLATGRPVEPGSAFMIQSTTKVWTATLVMQLVDEGLVVLDAPVRRYLPEFTTADAEAAARITVRHLLTHTGGFEGDLWEPTSEGDDALARFVSEHVAAAPQHAEPGAFFSYCSAGLGVLGRIVEVLRGTTYDEALRHHLADPLGLDEVVVHAGEAALAPDVAIGHVRGGPDDPLRPLRTWAVMPRSNPAAGNQLAMSARNLMAFARMHLADGAGPDGAHLLSANSARLMRQPQVCLRPATHRGQEQGLGWRLGPGTVEHGGDAPGNSCMFRLAPGEGRALVVLANGGDTGGLFAGLGEQLWQPPTDPPPETDAPEDAAEDAARLLGRYELRTQVAEVTLDGTGRLLLTRAARGEAVTMAALAGEGLEPQVRELRSAGGRTYTCLRPDGRAAGAVEFIGSDERGRARFLHDGRAAPRVD